MLFRIKALRDAQEMTQERLAKLSGISRAYLSQIETGRHNKGTSIDVLLNIAAALNVHPRELFEAEPAGFGAGDLEVYHPPAGSAPGLPVAEFNSAITYFKVTNNHALGLGYPKGTVLFVDMNRRPVDGDAVVATETDEHLVASRTMIGRYLHGLVLGGRFMTDPSDRLDAAAPSVKLRGVVLGAVTRNEPAESAA